MKIVFCGGGTSGHVTPALALIEELRKTKGDHSIVFIGRTDGPENKAIIRENVELRTIEIKGLRHKLSFENFGIIIKALKANQDAKKLLLDLQPDIVIGTGGYVCWPVLRAARSLKTKTVIHESNAFPGMVTRMLAKKCDLVLLGMKIAEKYIKSKNTKYVGNPVSSSFFDADKSILRRQLGIKENDIFIVSFGGSLGAEILNKIMVQIIKTNNSKNIVFLHATGIREYERYKKESPAFERSKIVPFIDNMKDVLPAADIAITRSGAMTVSELAAAGTPAILIPSPNVSANHQLKNALAFEEAGAAVIIEEKNLTKERVLSEITALINDKRKLSKMAFDARKMANKKCKTEIIRIIEKTVDN